MKFKIKAIGILLIISIAAITRASAQVSEIENLFHDLEVMDAGTQAPFDKADPVLERLVQSNRENVVQALPVILQAASDPHLSVRRVAAMALYRITTRRDGQALLSTATSTFTALLTDTDIPIRRISILAVATLRPDANSPLVPVLKNYLARQDAVSTIGPAVATVLMEAAPHDLDSTKSVVQFMRRKDQTSASRDVLMDAIVNVAKSHSREIGKEVAGYVDDPNEQTSVHAIRALQWIGKDVVLDNQECLSRIAADASRTAVVRAAATNALSAVR